MCGRFRGCALAGLAALAHAGELLADGERDDAGRAEHGFGYYHRGVIGDDLTKRHLRIRLTAPTHVGTLLTSVGAGWWRFWEIG